jgi:hypothetical protein
MYAAVFYIGCYLELVHERVTTLGMRNVYKTLNIFRELKVHSFAGKQGFVIVTVEV